MIESLRASQDAQVVSLVERRNLEITRMLHDLHSDVITIKNDLDREYAELKELIRLPFLEETSMGENVVDFQAFKNNKQKLQQNDAVASQSDVAHKIYNLISRTKYNMLFLYETKFMPIMEASHVLSVSEINYDFKSEDFKKFSDNEFADNPAFISLSYFIPSFVEYLAESASEFESAIDLIRDKSLDSVQLKKLLCQLRDDLQSGLKNSEYFLENIDKNKSLK